MKQYTLSLFWIFVSVSAFSQWTQLNLNTPSNLYSIRSLGDSLYVGGLDTLFISYDDGASWSAKQIKDQELIQLIRKL